MSKKKLLAIGCILIFLIFFILNPIYQKHKEEKNILYAQANFVCAAIPLENKKANYAREEIETFLKEPPVVVIDYSYGLGLKTMAYNYYYGTQIDPYKIKELIEKGDMITVYNEYLDFLYWIIGSDGKKELEDYRSSIVYANIVMGKPPIDNGTITYQDYMDIINDPVGKQYMQGYLDKIKSSSSTR